jgi:hypothetical protein
VGAREFEQKQKNHGATVVPPALKSNPTDGISTEAAEKILQADLQNLIHKVAAGKPLTVAERARIESRAADSVETMAYTKTLVELAAVLGVSRRTLTNWQKMEGAPKALSNGLWPVADWREFVRIRGLSAGRVPVGNEEAWESMKTNIREAKKAAMQVWVCDENGYPSPQAGGLVVAADPGFELRVLAQLDPQAQRLGNCCVNVVPVAASVKTKLGRGGSAED